MRDSKITFRVSDDLLDRVDGIDESRSEIMRDALRQYLERGAGGRPAETTRKTAETARVTLDDLVRDMVREVVKDEVDTRDDINVTVNVPEGRSGRAEPAPRREPQEGADEAPAGPPVEGEGSGDGGKTCAQCGEGVDEGHVYCPNCGEKASRRVFCDCGDEIRSDWSFCPSCGRRTPTSHALNR